MRAIFKFILLSTFLVFTAIAGYASKIEVNREQIEVRRPSPDKVAKYLSDGDFRYETDYTRKLSFWDAFWRWVNRHLFSPLITKHGLTIWEVIKYSIIGITIVLVVYFLIKGDKVGLFFRGAKNVSIEALGMEEDINAMNFDKLINDAIAAGQYRVAIRYLYLKLLKDLSDNNLITWKAEKTNRDYINELRPSPFGKPFRQVTMLFDYAWYGEATINETSFKQIKDSFLQLYTQLNKPS